MDVLLGGTALLILLVLLASSVVFLTYVPVGLWISAVTAGVNIRMSELIGMRRRKVPQELIVLHKIAADKAGVEVSVRQLEAHYLAGGDVTEVVHTLIRARRANVELAFEEVAALDLADDGGKTLDALVSSLDDRQA